MEIKTSKTFLCDCCQYEGWITEGCETESCPHCGRKYFGHYNKTTKELEAIEIPDKKETYDGLA